MVTEIHEDPRYEDKIQWIQEVLEGARQGLRDFGELTSYIGGILNCVSQELYLRYAISYADFKRRQNGDLTMQMKPEGI